MISSISSRTSSRTDVTSSQVPFILITELMELIKLELPPSILSRPKAAIVAQSGRLWIPGENHE
jgi:hypothetical protein